MMAYPRSFCTFVFDIKPFIVRKTHYPPLISVMSMHSFIHPHDYSNFVWEILNYDRIAHPTS